MKTIFETRLDIKDVTREEDKVKKYEPTGKMKYYVNNIRVPHFVFSFIGKRVGVL